MVTIAMSDTIPQIVLTLAKEAATERVPNPKPIAWKQYPGSWVIVFEDGRKLNFVKTEAIPEATPPAESKPKRKTS
jgi:hypothetical protein